LQLKEVGDFAVPHVRDLPPFPKAIEIDTKHDLSRHSGKASFNPDPSGNRQFFVGANARPVPIRFAIGTGFATAVSLFPLRRTSCATHATKT